MRTSTSSIIIDASRELVWAAVTLPEHVRRWQYDSELTTEWIVGGPIRFRAEWEGQVFEQWGSVLEFDPPSRLRYSLFAPRPGLEDLPENHFTMTYELRAATGGTEVAFIQEDPREPDDIVVESDEDSPILIALKLVVESPSTQPS